MNWGAWKPRWSVFCLLGLSLPVLAWAADYDVVLRHGRVIDGTGNPAYFADVAIRDGRIVMVGRVDGAAREVLDATGLVVAPGFIDAHTHAENLEQPPNPWHPEIGRAHV